MLTIPANDFGHIRVFALDGPMPDGLADKTPDALRAVFGADTLKPDFIDVVQVADLDGLSLSRYIAQGYDITVDAADVAAMDKLAGIAVLILSNATAGAEVTLTPAAGVKHVTTCGAPAQMAAPAPLPATSAKGIIGDAPQKPPKSDAAIGGRVATVALIVMFAMAGLMIWMAS